MILQSHTQTQPKFSGTINFIGYKTNDFCSEIVFIRYNNKIINLLYILDTLTLNCLNCLKCFLIYV